MMKRIAVVADIHANIHALNVVMNYIDTKCEVSQILNLGDFIQIGPNPAEVYDVVMNDARFINIMGNSEYMFFDDEIMKRYSDESAHQDWVVKQLGKSRLDMLRQVPLQRIVDIEDKKFLMVHARMNSAIESPVLYAKGTFAEFMQDYDADANYVLIGHTHLPLYAVHWNGRPIINPGSIGCGKDGIARFAMIEIDGGMVDVTYKQLKYDKAKVIRDYAQNAVPCSEKFIAAFY